MLMASRLQRMCVFSGLKVDTHCLTTAVAQLLMQTASRDLDASS